MTICIGVLCADGKVAIAASDRMVTWGGITEFEHEVPKITMICEKVVTLVAGDALRGARLAREVKLQIPGASPEAREVAESISRKYVEQRHSQLESEILLPRGIRMREFYQGGLQQSMLGPLAGSIDLQVANYDFGVELLVVGCDDGGAHLFSVLNPGGSYSDHNQIGFHAIGSGMLHALQSLIGIRPYKCSNSVRVSFCCLCIKETGGGRPWGRARYGHSHNRLHSNDLVGQKHFGGVGQDLPRIRKAIDPRDERKSSKIEPKRA